METGAQDDLLGSDRLSSGVVTRLQALGTRLRFALAVPVAALVFVFADRGPVWPGALVALGGETLQMWATAHLRKNVQVITSGPYAWLRNPMYLGRFLVGLGLTLVTWRWFIVLPFAVCYCVYAQARVLGEERHLRQLFGEEYAAYYVRVRRWLPLPPRGPRSSERWSWEAVFRNHEHRVAAAIVLTLALLNWRIETFGRLGGGR